MKETNIISLDVGKKRIGVARANCNLGFATPLLTLKNDQDIWVNLKKIIADNNVVTIVIGLPRSLKDVDTSQTVYTREFANNLRNKFDLEIIFQDESLTTKIAQKELKSYKKPKYDKDSLAATYILEDYLTSIKN